MGLGPEGCCTTLGKNLFDEQIVIKDVSQNVRRIRWKSAPKTRYIRRNTVQRDCETTIGRELTKPHLFIDCGDVWENKEAIAFHFTSTDTLT
jgi:hypothetical protein